jgi:cobalt-zinc-cadmium resistance protein CzcA
MFTPLAWTLGSALLGALIFTLTLVPVMVSILMNKNVREKSNFLVDAVMKYSMKLFNYCFTHKRFTFITTGIITVLVFGP